MTADDPDFFTRLCEQQTPQYLWIGCSDSRVPATQIVDLTPGDIFVHRNVANIVVPTDLNCLSVMQFAVEVLRVRHIIVCGHYGCGGVRAALENRRYGLIDEWLRHLKDVYRANLEPIERAVDDNQKVNLLCEYNVRAQVANVCAASIVQDAWASGQALSVHGWIYNIENGILKDLDLGESGAAQQ